MITRLRCINRTAAIACAGFLNEHGLIGVSVEIATVVVRDLTPSSVLRLAEDAFENGWATDEDCARIIAEIAVTAYEARRAGR